MKGIHFTILTLLFLVFSESKLLSQFTVTQNAPASAPVFLGSVEFTASSNIIVSRTSIDDALTLNLGPDAHYILASILVTQHRYVTHILLTISTLEILD